MYGCLFRSPTGRNSCTSAMNHGNRCTARRAWQVLGTDNSSSPFPKWRQNLDLRCLAIRSQHLSVLDSCWTVAGSQRSQPKHVSNPEYIFSRLHYSIVGPCALGCVGVSGQPVHHDNRKGQPSTHYKSKWPNIRIRDVVCSQHLLCWGETRL